MGLKILKLYVKGIGKTLSIYEKAADWWKERKSVDMEMNCPGRFMYPEIFSGEESIIGKCPYGEMKAK